MAINGMDDLEKKMDEEKRLKTKKLHVGITTLGSK